MSASTTVTMLCVLLCGSAYCAGAQVCKSNPPDASSLALAISRAPSALRRQKFLGTLEGVRKAKATFTALELIDPAKPGLTVRGLRISLDDEDRETVVYLDDEDYGPHADWSDYFAEIARVTALEIDRIQRPNTPESVSGGDLGLNNRRFPAGPVLNFGWDRTEGGSFTVHFHTRGCGSFFFPATAYSQTADIFTAASEFFGKASPQKTH